MSARESARELAQEKRASRGKPTAADLRMSTAHQTTTDGQDEPYQDNQRAKDARSIVGKTPRPNSVWTAGQAAAESYNAADLRNYLKGGTATDLVDAIATLAEDVAKWQEYAVQEARSDGATWSEVGNAMGITKQAAQQRFGKLF